jgi:predicted nucleotidyltransferase
MERARKKYIPLIVEKLKRLDPYKIILFGSYADGEATEDSDIDLIVVTHDDSIPRDYQENTQIYLRVSRILSDIQKEVPVDLIVYTKAIYSRFLECKSMFSRQVSQKGVVLYEAGNRRMV